MKRKQVQVLTCCALAVALTAGLLSSCKVTGGTTTKGKTTIIMSATDTTVINHRGTIKFPKSN